MSNVLAVGAHPDDIEAGCLGSLLKHADAGDHVFVVVATSGGYGSRSWDTIHSEMIAALEILGAPYVVLDNPIGHYGHTWKTVTELDDIITREKIDIIYTHWYGDSHQDHQAAYKNTLAAARNKQIRSFYCYELPDYSYRSGAAFDARRYVDITAYLDRKLAAMAAYSSYIGEHHLMAARGLADYRGLACGHLRQAEAFEVIFETWIDIIAPAKAGS